MKRPRLPKGPNHESLAGVYDGVMRALAKVVTDRRWAAPLSAMALGFGLFLGVAIGPGADGSLATSASQIVAIPAPEPADEAEAEAEPAFTAEPEAELFEESESEAFEPEPLGEEFASEPAESAPEPEEKTTPPAAEPDAEEEETEAVAVKGTVVRVNPAARSYTLAAPGGELVSVHAAKLPAPGAKLAVEATPLPNNTFAEEQRKAGGSATAASFAGVVTYVDPDPAAPAYAVSGRGSSILVHADPTQAAALPVLGAYAKVTVGLEPAPPAAPAPPPDPALAPPPCAPDPALVSPAKPKTVAVQRSLEVEAEPATYVDLAGVVSAVCPQTGQLLISADDLRESDADLLLAVRPQLKTAGLKPGDSVLASATLEAGVLTLAGLASDEGSEGAEDTAAAQGDLAR